MPGKSGNAKGRDSRLERAHREGRYEDAEAIVREELVETPDSHWLWARRAMYVRHFGKAGESLEYAKKAVGLAPACPLAQWELAAALEENEVWDEAIAVYSKIIQRGVEDMQGEDCFEGESWSRGLIADCWYYKSLCLLELDRLEEAEVCFATGMGLRRRGQITVLPVREAKKQYQDIRAKRLARTLSKS